MRYTWPFLWYPWLPVSKNWHFGHLLIHACTLYWNAHAKERGMAKVQEMSKSKRVESSWMSQNWIITDCFGTALRLSLPVGHKHKRFYFLYKSNIELLCAKWFAKGETEPFKLLMYSQKQHILTPIRLNRSYIIRLYSNVLRSYILIDLNFIIKSFFTIKAKLSVPHVLLSDMLLDIVTADPK